MGCTITCGRENYSIILSPVQFDSCALFVVPSFMRTWKIVCSAIVVCVTAISMSYAKDIFEGWLHVSNCGSAAPKRTFWSRDQLKANLPTRLHAAADKYIDASSGSINITSSQVTRLVSYSGLLTQAGVSVLERQLRDAGQAYEAILVNSLGGDAAAALKLSEIVRDARMKLIVDGFCASACANHLLAPRLTDGVEVRGIVLLHGSSTTCLASRSTFDHIRLLGVEKWWHLRVWALQEDRVKRPLLFKSALSLSQRPDRGALDGQPRSFLKLAPDLLVQMGAKVDRSSAVSLDGYIQWLIDQKRFGFLPYVTFNNGSEILRASAIASNSAGK
jgi:hypothetical protein